MLKLKYLFHHTDLAIMLLNYWNFDEKSLEMFKHYRISSNAVYPFRWQGQVHLLRFAPKAEKLPSNILAELDFIAYLRSCRYGVLESVRSKQGEELVEADTPWGTYYASVFKRVPGVPMDKSDFGDDAIYCYGQALGRLHALSGQYSHGANRRWSHRDVLDWMQTALADFPDEQAVRAETQMLLDYFAAIPRSPERYGLIHYDFQCDNVFYDRASQACYAIDFDDAMYHWYAMDIAQAVDSLKDEILPDSLEHKQRRFMDGYTAEFALSGDWEELLPACRRFARAYRYVRVLRAMQEQWQHEPEWMTALRSRLTQRMHEDSLDFGKSLW